MFREKAGDGRRNKIPLDGNADVAGLCDVQRQPRDLITLRVKNEVMHDADAKPCFDHGKKRKVTGDVIGDARRNMRLIQKAVDLIVLDLLEIDETLVGQLGKREAGLLCHRVIERQDRDKGVAQKERQIKLVGHRRDKEAAVDRAAAQPIGDLVVFSVEQLDLDVGVLGMKGLEDSGQNAGGQARKAADTQCAGLCAVQLGNGKIKILIILDDLSDRGEERHTVRGDLNAGMVAREQRALPVSLQIGNHFADGGLGVAQIIGSLRNAAGFDRAQVSDVFAKTHFFHRLSLLYSILE